MIMNSPTNNIMVDFIKMIFSSIPEDEFETKLRDFGIEDRHIKTLKQMAGYNSQTNDNEGGDDL